MLALHPQDPGGRHMPCQAASSSLAPTPPPPPGRDRSGHRPLAKYFRFDSGKSGRNIFLVPSQAHSEGSEFLEAEFPVSDKMFLQPCTYHCPSPHLPSPPVQVYTGGTEVSTVPAGPVPCLIHRHHCGWSLSR